jgi:2-desacetyl-2-hydroxyethyl bacteriochlorophyllide A dehydrogenase
MANASRHRVRFPSPESAEVVTEEAPLPDAREVRVRTRFSAISPGTERLVYQGNVPDNIEADTSINAFQGEDLSYPISYGYACVGEVDKLGAEVDETWRGTRVFAFQPHVSRFVSSVEALVPLPDSADLIDAVMLPSLETAVNLVMDGRPVIGEMVLVLGQGVVGLLTTRLLADFPLSTLVTVDPLSARRAKSEAMGATEALGTLSTPALENASTLPTNSSSDRERANADLTYELAGQPSALNDAIHHTGFDGRIVVGSWYGTKRAPIDLGGRFHRSRIQIISSQVSTVAPKYQGRWSKSRRMSVVVGLLDRVQPSQLITDRFSVEQAPHVYEELASESPMLQPVFEYE